MAKTTWYVHLWVCGHYSGAYKYDSLCEAVKHRDRSANTLGVLGCRYQLSDRKRL